MGDTVKLAVRKRISLDIQAPQTVADEPQEAKERLKRLEEIQQPMRITPELIRKTINEMSWLLEDAVLDTAWPGSATCRVRAQRAPSHI